MSDLSILCVTRAEREVRPLLHRLVDDAISLGAECVLACDGNGLHAEWLSFSSRLWAVWGARIAEAPRLVIVQSEGYVESVLDEALSHTTRDYVLRIDDDESLSRWMMEWLKGKHYQSAASWKFPRAHLAIDEEHYITNPPLWRDHQTRLSIRSLAGGRHTIHCGSPFGGGTLAPVPLLHHKFLVKSLAQRAEIITRYERCQPGAGSNFAVFSTPELVTDDIDIAPLDRAIAESINDCVDKEIVQPVSALC